MTAPREKKRDEVVRSVAVNRKARYDYSVDQEIECGVVLRGTEVKSIRDGHVQLHEAYATIDRGECFLHQLHIGEYSHGNIYNHEPRRTRKLLLHKAEIQKWDRKSSEKGYTLIPLELYFRDGKAKIKLGLCRGKKEFDKRQTIAKRDADRELRQRAVRRE